MEKLRVSATDIDALRRFRDDEGADLADLLAQLRRESPPTPAMMAGTALHKALEFAPDGEFEMLEADGYTFTFAASAEVDIPAIREIKATREYLIDGCAVTLVGKVDAVHGRRVDDHKFTSRYDAERFLNSYQWRIYLEVFEADEFRWNVFEGRETGEKQYTINSVHPLTMHRYPGMAEDVERELRAFVDLARRHLPEKIEAPFLHPLMAG